MDPEHRGKSFAGREFDTEELALIREVVDSCRGVSRTELAHTVCELLNWRRPSGSLKGPECRQMLECLASEGFVVLPEKRPRRPLGRRTTVPRTPRGEPGQALEGSVREYRPVFVEPLVDRDQRLLFRELVGRYHYLGHAVPYGAHLRYLVWVSVPGDRAVAGCLQFSSPAWRMAARDRWIGWPDALRARNLQRVLSNSRFLILPWVRIRNLASTVLSLATRRLASDWLERYAVKPLLVETLVDEQRYRGTCYRAANWIDLGRTSGRGRMDREHRRHGLVPKKVLVYPLVPEAARQLRESEE